MDILRGLGMKHLRTLVDVALLPGMSMTEGRIPDADGDDPTKVAELLHAVREGRVRSDEEARALLYPERGYVPITTYHSVKTRLYDRLVDVIATGKLTRSDADEAESSRSDLLRYLQAVQVLMTVGEMASARHLAVRAVRMARRHGWTSFIITCLDAMLACGSDPADHSASKKIIDELEYWRNVRDAEERAWTRVYSAPSRSLWEVCTERERREIAEGVSAIEADRRTYETHSLVEASFALRCTWYKGSQDYEGIIDLHGEQQRYYRTHPHVRTRQGMVRVTLAAMMAHVWSGDHARAERLLWDCEQVARTGTPLWFEVQEHAMVLWLRTGRVREAEELWKTMNGHLAETDEHRLTTWSVLEVYVRFLRMSSGEDDGARGGGAVRDDAATVGVRRTMMDGAMRRDEPGFNVVQVIARVLSEFLDGRYERLSMRDESLQTLRRKKLRHVSRRLDVFVRLLHVLIDCGFDWRRCEVKGARMWTELRTARLMHDRGEYDMLEVIPFDEVWTRMIRVLKERKEGNRTTVS